MATLFLYFFCRTNDKKCRKNVFAENMDVRERRTNMKTLRAYLLIQRIFIKFSQKVILFLQKTLDNLVCVRYNNMRRPGNGHNRICGCGGTGRRARLRI